MMIRDRLDAHIWQAIVAAFEARTLYRDTPGAWELYDTKTRAVCAALVDGWHSERAAYLLDDRRHDWLVDLLRETSPDRRPGLRVVA